MSKPICTFFISRGFTDRRHAPPEDERTATYGKLGAAFEAAGGKRVVSCFCGWWNQRYRWWGGEMFGSVVRGEATEASDLDILVEYEQAPTLFEFVRLQAHLSEVLGVLVDLVMRSALKPAIGRAILAEMLPV